MPHEFEEIRSLQRIASRHDELGWRAPEPLELLEEGRGLGGAELSAVASGDCLGSTMLARQVAGPRQLPIDQSGGIREDEFVRPVGTHIEG